MNGLSAWSIRKPVPTLVLFLVLTLGGLWSYGKLRINNVPDIDVPVVLVTVAQPGAAPPELETSITRQVEDAVAGLGSINHIRSTINDGVSVTSIEFVIGTNLDRATNDVRNAVSRIRSSLPADVQDPVVQRVDSSGDPVLIYAVRAPGKSPQELSWLVDNDIAKALLGLKGVNAVGRTGGVDREIRITPDPSRLQALSVTAAEISQALARSNINIPGGKAAQGGSEQSIRTLGAARTVEELAATRIDLPDGRSFRLSDLAKVEDAWNEPSYRARLNGEEVVAFSVTRGQGTSEVGVALKVRAAVKDFMAANPGIEIKEITTSVDFVMDSYYASVEALVLGALLAVGVVWWFLRDMRGTLVSAAALPLALVPTFFAMYLLDQSFNIVTLLALSLTVGILVDDAIVEIENIIRHMREGKAAYPAALEAADEIGLAVVATTFTIVAVFAPVGFMPGVVGQFFKAFAVASCVSVLFSLVVARTITPLMAAFLLRRQTGHGDDTPSWMPFYLRWLTWALAHRRKVILGGLGIFILSLGLTAFLPSDFVPAADRGRSVMSVELPPGVRLADTDRAVLDITRMMRAHPAVDSVYGAAGMGLSVSQSGPTASASGDVRKATVFINLKPKGQRDIGQLEFEKIMAAKLADLPGVRTRFGADGSGGARLGITLTGDDPVRLSETALTLEREMRTIGRLSNIASTANLTRPEILIRPQSDKAARMGVTADSISRTVRVATIGDAEQSLPKFNLADRRIPIRVRLDEEARSATSVIAGLRVPMAGGGSVPLSSVADITYGAGPTQIDRLDRRRSATVEAELGGMALGEATALVKDLPVMRKLPDGIRELPSGDSEALNDLFGGFLVAFATGILLMYVVLALLFGGFAHPFTILTALPLSIGGAFGGLLLFGFSLSLPAMIGLLMLMGIAAKNSILLVEYIIEARAAGVPRREAIFEAARKRARPIIMTTVAMGAGLAPIALGIGADIEFRQPMAVAVIGGLVTSTLLSLIYVPVVYSVVDDLQGWVIRKMGKALEPDKETGPPLSLAAD